MYTPFIRATCMDHVSISQTLVVQRGGIRRICTADDLGPPMEIIDEVAAITVDEVDRNEISCIAMRSMAMMMIAT